MPHRFIKLLINHIEKRKLGFWLISRNQWMSLPILNTTNWDVARAPKFLFYAHSRNGKKLNRKKWFEHPPDLTLDITDYFEGANAPALRMLRCGAAAVIYADRAMQRLHIYHTGNRIDILEKNDSFELSKLLPGLKVKVEEVLPEANPERDPPKATLFDPTAYPSDRRPGKLGQTYASWLPSEARDSDHLYNSDELAIFRDVVRSEAPINEDYLSIHGALRLKVDNRELDLTSKQWDAFGWVESDRIQLKVCGAKGILLFDKGTTFSGVKRAGGAKKLNMILAHGYGIPRTNARRLLHRIAKQFKLPVYVIADNDTWGYYLFSVLKRGSIAPVHSVPELAISDLRYLGIRAGDLAGVPNSKHYCRSWKQKWDRRLNAMLKYDCFRSNDWQQEFKNFSRQQAALETAGLIFGLHKTFKVKGTVSDAYKFFVKQYIQKKLAEKSWLI